MEVYLDNAATTRLDDEVLDAMLPYMREHYGNASSPHRLGRRARFAVEEARERIASELNAEPGEIVFTSGGTEANNLALWGGAGQHGTALITVKTEHESVLAPGHDLERHGLKVAMLDPSPDGPVRLDDVESAMDQVATSGLVSVMHTNNETGALNDIPSLSERCRQRGWLLHTDAVQALGWDRLDVERLGMDLMTISAHKIYGPKGVGALFVRGDTVQLRPIVAGGSQERRRRGGTENVAAIVGFARAVELSAGHRSERQAHLERLKARLLMGLQPLLARGAVLNTPERSAPHLLSISFPPDGEKAVDGEMLLLNLDVEGIRVSSGSACTSGTVEPSHVLTAMGRDAATAAATLRFSLGKDNSLDEMDYVASQVETIVSRMSA